ncbi:PLAC8-domain-containing protein [Aspergillus lentulus]|nr:PLAC8-domain-containing protein [Aspergillus lentulus]
MWIGATLSGAVAPQWGHVQSQLNNPGLRPSSCNRDCCLFLILSCCGFHWVPLALQQATIRTKLHIKGSGCADCLSSFCCASCVLIQHEKELQERSANDLGYRRPAGMDYSRQ